MFESLSFQHPFRTYQRMVLAQIEGAEAEGQSDRRYHIVSPPGSGKTIVGLELIRRWGEPAVVFAPTTTIQRQWQEKVGMFTADPGEVSRVTSLDPQRLAPITVFTYQLISTPGEAEEAARAAAVGDWATQLVEDGQVADDAAAAARIERLRQNNRRAYEREVLNRHLRLKRKLLRSGGVDPARFLHPNARALVDALVAHGVRTVVLDECHHLLDYWAIVLAELIRRLDSPRVVGLTATLPSPEDEREYENYTSLLGEVDFEVPTPAVVKEGSLAPYRDLAMFVRPSDRELAYLRNIEAEFRAATNETAGEPRFGAWLRRIVIERPGPDGRQRPWPEALNADPVLVVAAVRALREREDVIPAGLLVPAEADGPPALDDWLALLERYALDELKPSPEREDHARLARLRRALLPFGLTLTERGLRQHRSPGDLVLALSEAKDEAVVTILAAEAKALGERLRAVVVTDFERMSAGTKRVRGVLERDAGSAYRVFRRLVEDPAARDLNPVLVTGRTVLVDEAHEAWIAGALSGYLRDAGLRATCRLIPTDVPDVHEIVGEGADWTPGIYTRVMTRAFEEGRVRCLVGTRGILGEGWDALALNTLVDLTSVTTSTSVQQLRGRSIRLDPTWKEKVAHNWDVVCVSRDFARGDADLRRFRRKHERFWGIVPAVRAPVLRAAASPIEATASPVGEIVKGVSHVDHWLAMELETREFRTVDYGAVNRRQLSQVGDRAESYELWRIGDPYSNFCYAKSVVEPTNVDFPTAWTLSETLAAMIRAFRASFATVFAIAIYLAASAFGEGVQAGVPEGLLFPLVGLVLLLGLVVALVLNARSAWRIAKRALFEQPPDAILLDVGRAVLEGVRDAGLVSRELQPEFVRVVERPDKSLEVYLDYASAADSRAFTDAFGQVFAPVRDQRYLILRDDRRLPRMSWLWRVLRPAVGRVRGQRATWLPVPDPLGVRRERAQAYARAWSRWVGGGQLVHTRSAEGRDVLLRARAEAHKRVGTLAFEAWR